MSGQMDACMKEDFPTMSSNILSYIDTAKEGWLIRTVNKSKEFGKKETSCPQKATKKSSNTKTNPYVVQ